ncbi:MAG: hypothetical protein ACJ763_04015 [Bdellovibrionia bacterium]
MKSTIISVLLFLTTLASAYAGKGGEGVGGGGGVVKNGRYMTFYSAGLYVEPEESISGLPEQIPVLNELFDYIAGLELIDTKVRTDFLNAILPTPVRQYHTASPQELTPEIYKRLMAEFQRVTGVDPANLQLFALTDIPQKTTYLLPGFEKLSHNDQMAILFHEAYWIVHPESTYNQVVSAEMAFQAVLSQPNNYAAAYDFVTRVGASHLKGVYALAKWDLAQGNLNGFVNKRGEFPLSQLYGEEYIKCLIPLAGYNYSWAIEPCDIYFRKNINSLRAKYPKSMIFKKIAESLVHQDKVVGYIGQSGSGTGPNAEGVVAVHDELFFKTESVIRRLMDCPVHLLETDKVDCRPGGFFEGGHLLLNF